MKKQAPDSSRGLFFTFLLLLQFVRVVVRTVLVGTAVGDGSGPF